MALNLTRDLIGNSLDAARETEAESFRLREQAWLEAELPLAKLALDSFIAEEPTEEIQIAGRLGVLLGGSILRCGLETGAADPQSLRVHHGETLIGKKFAYPKEIPNIVVRDLFGESSEPITDIRHPASKTLCAAVLMASLSPRLPEQMDAYVVFPRAALRRNKPRSIRRQARG